MSWPPTARARFDEAKRAYGALYDRVLEAWHAHDPVKIGMASPDEYAPEAASLLPRLRDAKSQQDVEKMVREEIVKWFSEHQARRVTDFGPIARDIWAAWCEHRDRNV
jgi:hypothetical protein